MGQLHVGVGRVGINIVLKHPPRPFAHPLAAIKNHSVVDPEVTVYTICGTRQERIHDWVFAVGLRYWGKPPCGFAVLIHAVPQGGNPVVSAFPQPLLRGYRNH